MAPAETAEENIAVARLGKRLAAATGDAHWRALAEQAVHCPDVPDPRRGPAVFPGRAAGQTRSVPALSWRR